jgi:hypothetical protein
MFETEMSAYRAKRDRADVFYRGEFNAQSLGMGINRALWKRVKMSVSWARIGMEKFTDRIIIDNTDIPPHVKSQLMKALRNAVVYGQGVVEVSPSQRLRVLNPMKTTGVLDDYGDTAFVMYQDRESKAYTWNSSIVNVNNPDNVATLPGTPFVLAYNWDEDHPCGQSRITTPLVRIIKSSVRNLVRSEVAAELQAFPLTYAINVLDDPTQDVGYGQLSDDEMAQREKDKEASKENVRRWASGMGDILSLNSDPDTGLEPKLGQLQQLTLEPLNSQTRQLASIAAAEMNIHPSELGVYNSNPTSEQSLYSSKEDLILEIQRFEDSVTEMLNRILDAMGVEATVSFADPATPSQSVRANSFSQIVATVPEITRFPEGLKFAGLPPELTDKVIAEREKNGEPQTQPSQPGSIAAPSGGEDKNALA